MTARVRALEVLVFAIAMFATLLVGTAYTIYILGHSEGAIGSLLHNVAQSALLLLPVAAVSTIGYWLVRLRTTRVGPPRYLLIVTSAIISGALFFAGAFLAPTMDSFVVNLAAIIVYCLMLGAVSGFVAATLRGNNGAV